MSGRHLAVVGLLRTCWAGHQLHYQIYSVSCSLSNKSINGNRTARVPRRDSHALRQSCSKSVAWFLLQHGKRVSRTTSSSCVTYSTSWMWPELSAAGCVFIGKTFHCVFLSWPYFDIMSWFQVWRCCFNVWTTYTLQTEAFRFGI